MMRHAFPAAVIVLVTAMLASSVQAMCLAPLTAPPRADATPPTAAEVRASRLAEQTRLFEFGQVALQVELVEHWDTSIPGLPERPGLPPGLNAILRPVTVVKGEGPERIVITYPNPQCGWGFLIGTPARAEVGDRFVIFANSAQAAAVGQTLVTMRRDDLLEPTVLAALAAVDTGPPVRNRR